MDEGKPHDSAKDNEDEAIEGRDKRAAMVRKIKNLRRRPRATPHLRTRQLLKQYDQSCGNCSDSSTTEREVQNATYKKNAEANTRARDLNQKTMQALDTLAKEHEIFEETMKTVTLETEEGDMLYAVASEVGEERTRKRAPTKSVA